ncbi:hypothetical protein [Marinibactrum halimedae]|uniref:Uncharacterized protein n=1 Tax=Marinibactrum halimedae TaxID=1444977 RepID=A0AA37WPG2_9GAMM|nr:hypothetical protein [Marinibactrum halimedae]MCD9458647.1 hypothetical protein [Marinibactrum halimedae]GLS25987.1 hypothetical protein GCM10007877_17020 [Marinibactrum halimedae]
MTHTEWQVDIERLQATHDSGFTVTIEGSLRSPSTVHPGSFPEGLSALEQVKLLREGMDALSKAAGNRPRDTHFTARSGSARSGFSTRSETRQPTVVKKPSSIVLSDRKKKPLLSLKKKPAPENA